MIPARKTRICRGATSVPNATGPASARSPQSVLYHASKAVATRLAGQNPGRRRVSPSHYYYFTAATPKSEQHTLVAHAAGDAVLVEVLQQRQRVLATGLKAVPVAGDGNRALFGNHRAHGRH